MIKTLLFGHRIKFSHIHSKREPLDQSWLTDGRLSTTLAQHWASFGSRSCVWCDEWSGEKAFDNYVKAPRMVAEWYDV